MTKKADDLARANRDAYFRSHWTNGKRTAPELVVGDVVAYSRYFLMQIGAEPTDPMWFRLGEVVRLLPELGWVEVCWDDDLELVLIAGSNLALPGPNLRYCD